VFGLGRIDADNELAGDPVAFSAKLVLDQELLLSFYGNASRKSLWKKDVLAILK